MAEPTPIMTLAVLISGEGSNLQAILDAIAAGALPMRVAVVVSDRAAVPGLARAAHAGVPAVVVDRDDHESAKEFFTALTRAVAAARPEMVVLAGFMRVLPQEFIDHFDGRVVNIHPSLLPKFKGTDTHRRAIAAGERCHGATVHWVTTALDSGPPIMQAKVPIKSGDDPERLRRRVLRTEHGLYCSALQKIAQSYSQGAWS